MNESSMTPVDNALLACLEGDIDAAMLVRRDVGLESVLPAAYFFRDAPDFNAFERQAVAFASGHVLDMGCGAGSVALALQRQGRRVTAIDISPDAGTVARRRGVENARIADVFSFDDGRFDTLLMLGHGIGMVETIDGLRRFLAHAHTLLAEGGQWLLDSLDVRAGGDSRNRAYQDPHRIAGRYMGEVRMQYSFRGVAGPMCGWLHVDADTLGGYAVEAGWRCAVIDRDARGNYLACLQRSLTG
jgi:SAM-dependent methyltransferase